jgi:hypothetical protein
MKRFQQAGRLGIIAWMTTMAWVTLIWVALAWATGCSRQLAVPGSAGTPDRKQLPFDRVSDNRGISPTAAFASEAIPAGTEVTVRLRLALSSADSRAGDSFEAVLDEPLVVAGKNIVPPSSLVTGRVVATKAGGRYDPGYLRLTLASIAINGKPFPLQTSSIFARGRSYEKRNHAASTPPPESDGIGLASGPAADSAPATQTSRAHNPADVKFSTGHRFTFRLAQPLLLQD